ncbi:hypothetical protein [Streptomyces tsukubensis]|uniref:hypothetical protein n=1 Tax=Streptomyces tsukubensis TaxID=83656 RepID=UPI00344CA0B7
MSDNHTTSTASTETSGGSGQDQSGPAAPPDVMTQLRDAHRALGDAVTNRLAAETPPPAA